MDVVEHIGIYQYSWQGWDHVMSAKHQERHQVWGMFSNASIDSNSALLLLGVALGPQRAFSALEATTIWPNRSV